MIIKKQSILSFILIVSTLCLGCKASKDIDNNDNNLVVIPKGEKNIQRYLNAIKGPTILQFEEGTYIISEPLTITGKKDFSIVGKNKTIIKAKNGLPKKNGGMIIIRDCAYFDISNLTLDANIENRRTENNQIPSHNLRLLGVHDFVVDNIDFPSCMQDGIVVQQTKSFPYQGVIKNCKIQKYWRSGISIINGMDIDILNCHFDAAQEDVTGGGINVEENDFNKKPNTGINIKECIFNKQKYGIQFSSKGLGSGECSISNCTFVNGQRGIYNSFRNTKIDSCIFKFNKCDKAKYSLIRNKQHYKLDRVNMEIRNSIFLENEAEAICYSDGNVHDLVVENCKFENNRGYLMSYYGQNLKILGNDFIGSGKNTISSFNEVSSVEIRNNNFTQINSRVLYVKNGQSLIVENNTFQTKNTYKREITKVIAVEKYSIKGNKVNENREASKLESAFIINGKTVNKYE